MTILALIPMVARDAPEPLPLAVIVNETRVEYGAARIAEDAALNEIAAIRAQEIVADFSHGDRLSQLASAYGIHTGTLGENLARTQSSIKRAVDLWLESPSHRAILLDRWDEMGTAVLELDGTYYIVLVCHLR